MSFKSEDYWFANRPKRDVARARHLSRKLTVCLAAHLHESGLSANDPIADVRQFDESVSVTSQEASEPNGEEGVGCAWALLGVNVVLMGLVVLSFAQGPYSSDEQELWYRYGSLSLFLAGAALPAIALSAARRSRWVVRSSTAWMLALLLVFGWYAMMSGGGV